MTDQAPPPGWYPDPSDPSQQRYWDGTAWSEHTAAQTPQAPQPAGGFTAGGVPAPMGGGMQGGAPPDTWLWQSIVATLFCCLPFGIAGIVNASKANSLIGAGDIAGARRAAEAAKKWTLVSAGVGVAGILLYFVFVAVIMGASSSF